MMSMEVRAMELGAAAVWAREGVARGVVVIAMMREDFQFQYAHVCARRRCCRGELRSTSRSAL